MWKDTLLMLISPRIWPTYLFSIGEIMNILRLMKDDTFQKFFLESYFPFVEKENHLHHPAIVKSVKLIFCFFDNPQNINLYQLVSFL